MSDQVPGEMGKEESRKRQKLAYKTTCRGSWGIKKVELSKCKNPSKVMLSKYNNADQGIHFRKSAAFLLSKLAMLSKVEMSFSVVHRHRGLCQVGRVFVP